MGVGGSSFNRGVLFVSDKYTAKFVMGADGGYVVSTAKRAQTLGLRARLRKIPLLKGLSSLFLGQRLPALLVLFTLFVDFFPRAAGERWDTAILIISLLGTAAIAIYVLKNMLLNLKSVWQYHGAEHKTIYAQEHGLPLTLERVRACPRVAKRCGTNLAVFILLFYLPLRLLIPYESLAIIAAYVLAYEIFDMKKADKYPLSGWLFKLGYWCQQHLFTREPADEQLIAAIAAMKKLIELESGDVV